VDLGTYPGDQSSVAYDIDSAGTAVGSSFDPANNEHAAQFAGGRVTRLGERPGDLGSHAAGINDLGQAVGWSAPPRGDSHAVIFAGGQVIDLGISPGGTYSIGTATDYFAHAL
jgi:probable HAF family extracellular repeat protein